MNSNFIIRPGHPNLMNWLHFSLRPAAMTNVCFRFVQFAHRVNCTIFIIASHSHGEILVSVSSRNAGRLCSASSRQFFSVVYCSRVFCYRLATGYIEWALDSYNPALASFTLAFSCSLIHFYRHSSSTCFFLSRYVRFA